MLEVTVEWKDIVGKAEWLKPDELTGPVRCLSRGWIVKEHPHWIAIAGCVNFEDYDTLDEVSNVDQIPIGCITMIYTS